jgi:hypothetical protein
VCERPESAYYDDVSDAWYVSCQAKADVPGDGFVAQVSADGTSIVTAQLVAGLNEPKGIRVNDGKLYVSDVTELVTVNLSNASIVAKTSIVGIDTAVPEAPFLNDVVVDPSTGDVYVSDNRNGVLFRFDSEGAAPELLVRSATLETPNGLLIDARDAENPRLLIASMGPGLNPQRGVTEKLGAVLSVALDDLNDGDGAVEVTYLSQRIGNLDGIELDGEDLLVTDFFAGRLMRVTPVTTTPSFDMTGDAKLLRQSFLRSADLGIHHQRRLIGVPETNNGTVVFIDLATL